MRRLFRASCVALVLAMLVGCKSTDVVNGASVSFEFPFVGDYDVVNRTAFCWSDSFLTNSSAMYHHELAGPMAAIAASAYGSRLFMDVRSLMELGVPPERLMRCYEDNDKLSYRHKRYGRDVAGYTIGSRRCELPGKEFDIVFVVVRGTVGREDWLSNINMANEWGTATDLDMSMLPKCHEGFNKSARFVTDALLEYAKEYGIDLANAKILVTGHCRGAATANLIGKMLDDAVDGPKISPLANVKRENVFVYTIAAPNVTITPSSDTNDEKYRNIYNIVSQEDVVPFVPFKAWNGARYGRTLFLRSESSIFFESSFLHPGYVGMKNNFKKICGYEYCHALWGTCLIDKVQDLVMRISPTVGHFYYVKPEMRADGNTTSTHSWLEMVIWKNIPSSTDPNRNVSLMDDVACLAEAYKQVMGSDSLEFWRKHWGHKLRFWQSEKDDDSVVPDGRDFSRQPDRMDVVWKIACMHAPATFIAWMKSGVDHGMDSIYENWDEFENDED